jgi:hypothetical protein
MYPLPAPEHVHRVEQSVGELLTDLRTLTVQLRDLAGLPPAGRSAAPGAAERLRAQAQFVVWECALLRAQLVRLRETGRFEEEGAGLLVPGARPS